MGWLVPVQQRVVACLEGVWKASFGVNKDNSRAISSSFFMFIYLSISTASLYLSTFYFDSN